MTCSSLLIEKEIRREVFVKTSPMVNSTLNAEDIGSKSDL